MKAAFLCTAILVLTFWSSLAPAADETPANDLQILSFNIRLGVAKDGPNHWDLRKPLVLDVFRDHAPDVAGLQEAWAFQIEAIQERFPHFALVGRSRQVDPKKGEWCPILYRKDRFSLIDSGTFWLSETPDEAASTTWGNDIPRICTWALLEEVATGRRFYFYNTHFDHRSQPSRVAAAKLCLDKISKRDPSSSPAVFLGDLNAAESNPAIGILNEGLADTFVLANPEAPTTGRGTFNKWKGEKDGARIDYIFVSPNGFEVLESKILHDHSGDGRYPSDHYPVSARIRFPEKG